MKSRPSLAALWAAITLGSFNPAAIAQTFHANDLFLSNDIMENSDMQLMWKMKYGEYKKMDMMLGKMMQGEWSEEVFEMSRSNKEVLIEVVFVLGGLNDLSGVVVPYEFERMGFRTTKCTGNTCEGYAPMANLVELSEHWKVEFIKASLRPITNTGIVTSEGDQAMKSDIARSTYGLTGSGLMIGVLSDSFDCAASGTSTNYATDIATGDLPAGINVLSDLTSGCSDEGRAMLQLIHDVAPGANLAYHTAFGGTNVFASGILALADAGCDVIVDDGE